MTGRWQHLGESGRRTAAAVFAGLDGARALADASTATEADAAGTTARPSASAVWSALVDGRSLPAGAVGDPDFEALVAQAARIEIPRAAAAATEPDAVDRAAAGVRLRIVPSRGGPGQRYLLVTFDGTADEPSYPDRPTDALTGGTARAPTRLIAVRDDVAPLEIPMPVPVDGAVQILLDDTDPVLAALTDPDCRLYFL